MTPVAARGAPRGAKAATPEKRLAASAPAESESRVDVGRTSILIGPTAKYPQHFALQNWPNPWKG